MQNPGSDAGVFVIRASRSLLRARVFAVGDAETHSPPPPLPPPSLPPSPLSPLLSQLLPLPSLLPSLLLHDELSLASVLPRLSTSAVYSFPNKLEVLDVSYPESAELPLATTRSLRKKPSRIARITIPVGAKTASNRRIVIIQLKMRRSTAAPVGRAPPGDRSNAFIIMFKEDR